MVSVRESARDDGELLIVVQTDLQATRNLSLGQGNGKATLYLVSATTVAPVPTGLEHHVDHSAIKRRRFSNKLLRL
jgi:hypothetical protein